MKVLGLDNSTNVNGFAVIEDGELIDYGLIELKKDCPSDYDYMQRISELVKILDKMIMDIQPDIVGLEDTTLKKYGNKASSRNISVFKKLTESMSGVKLVSIFNDKEYTVAFPSQWRSGYGMPKKRSTQKKMAIEIVNDLYDLNLKKSEDDIAEAILIAKYVYENNS